MTNLLAALATAKETRRYAPTRTVGRRYYEDDDDDDDDDDHHNDLQNNHVFAV